MIGLASGSMVMLVFIPMFVGKFPTKPSNYFLKAPFGGRTLGMLAIAASFLFAGIVFAVKGEPSVSFNFSMVQPSNSEAAATFEKIKESFPAWSDRNLQLIAEGETWDELRGSAEKAVMELEKLKDEGTIVRYQWPVDLIPNADSISENISALERITFARERILEQVKASGFTDQGTALARMVLQSLATPANESESRPSKNDFNPPLQTSEIGELAEQSLAYAPDGRVFLSGNVMVSENVTEENIHQLAALDTDQTNLTSWAVIQADLLPSVRRDFLVIFIPATIVLLLALVGVFRSVRDAALSITVLVTVLALVNAFVVVTGQSWNFLSGMAIPLIVGTGIDYSIHLIFSLRRNGGDFAKVWNGVGKAICFCGLSTAIGFGSLLFASNEMLRSMGMLCSLGVLLTTALSVFVIPGLWQRVRH